MRGYRRGKRVISELVARIVTFVAVVGISLVIVGCGAGGSQEADSSPQQADRGIARGSGNDLVSVAAEQIAGKGFPLCDWIHQAIAESDEPLAVMVETIYAGTDAIPSATLLPDASGTEEYEIRSDSSSQVSCDMTGFARDPDYGDDLRARVAVRMQFSPDDFPAPDPQYGLEHNGRVIMDQNVLLDRKLRLEVSEFSGNAYTDYMPFLRAMVDYWDGGAWVQAQQAEAAAPLNWSNVVEICNRLDTDTLANMFALDPVELNLEARTTTNGVQCTFKSPPNTTSKRLGVVFYRWVDLDEFDYHASAVEASACAHAGDLVFYQDTGTCDPSSGMKGYGSVDTTAVDVTIQSNFWDEYIGDEATYMEYAAAIFASTEDLVLELEAADVQLEPEGPGPPEGYVQPEGEEPAQ